MRVCEMKMVSNIKNLKAGKCGGNTRTEVWGGGVTVYLHNNAIARWQADKGVLTISDCGWETSTTKSRLNAILDAFKLDRIYQDKFVWYRNNRACVFPEYIEGVHG